MAGRLPQNFAALADAALEAAQAVSTAQATRASSGAVLNVIGPGIPELVGGSADLTGSVNTQRKDSRTLTADDASGNYIHYGVREFAMTAVMSGFTLHGGIRPYGGTFLVFSDYARNAVRLASLMHQPVVLVYTHDSIGLGEDGPTHQPVEHLASLRAMPGLSLWRPGDAVETAIAWRAALERGNGPVALVLTRQALPQQARTREQLAAAARGGYTLIDCEGEPEAILIATGSELALAAEALRVLATKGRRIRLVSMPSTDVFEAQEPAWREAVLPRAVTRRVAVEAGARQCWWRYVGLDGEVIGIDRFGASGKGAELFRHFGFTTEHVVAAVEKLFI